MAGEQAEVLRLRVEATIPAELRDMIDMETMRAVASEQVAEALKRFWPLIDWKVSPE